MASRLTDWLLQELAEPFSAGVTAHFRTRHYATVDESADDNFHRVVDALLDF